MDNNYKNIMEKIFHVLEYKIINSNKSYLEIKILYGEK